MLPFMMPPSVNSDSKSVVASARLLPTTTTHSTRICTDLSRTIPETVTSSFALALLILWIALFSGIVDTANGQQLDVNTKRRYSNRVPIAWENVSECCQSVDGIDPEWSGEKRQHVVDLLPGQSTDFLLPPNEMVRVLGWDQGCLSSGEVELWLSDGSGLMRKLNVARTTDARSIVAAPDYSAWTVARLRRSPHADGSARFAIYTSRRTVNRGLDSYQGNLLNCGNQVEIHDDSDKRPRSYIVIKPGDRVKVGKRKNDSRVRFETRLDYNNDASQHRSYWMKVYVDGAIRKIVTFDTLPGRYERWFVDDNERLIGRREFAYLDFAEHENVEVEFSHSCYLRTEALGLKLCRTKANWDLVDHLVKNCAVYPHEAEVASQSLDGQSIHSLDGNLDPRFDPWLHHEEFLNVARDNSIRQGGLNAYMWMRAIATHRHGDPDYRDELTVPELARKIRGKFTHFRDLLPSSAEPMKPRSVRFPIRSIRSPKQPFRKIVLGEQHVEEAAKQLPSTLLFPLSSEHCEGPRSLVYRVPENLGPSMLRVVVDKASVKNEAMFSIQYDDGSPIQFWVGPTTDIHSSLMKPGYQEAAVVAFANRHAPFDGSTLGGPAASAKRNADSTVAATHEILIPNGVKKVTLSATSANRNPKLIGLQYLTTRYQKISESEWKYHQNEIRSGDPIRVEFSSMLLKNQEFDLTTLLDSHKATFEASIKQENSQLSTKTISDQDAIDLVAKTDQLKADENMIGLVEVLSDLANSSDRELNHEALLARADLLQRIGESFLSNRELRGLMAFGQDPELRQQALIRLLGYARKLPFAHLVAEQYMIFHMLNTDDPERQYQMSLELANQFAENDRLRMAFFMHPPTPSGAASEFHLRSLFEMRWWKLLNNLSDRVSEPKSRLWKGLAAIQRGNVRPGLESLELAGEEGRLWIEHWHAGVAINQQLKSPDLQQRLDAIVQWENWQSNHPGPRVWEPTPDLVVQCRGAAHIFSAMRNLRSQFFAASNAEPAIIEVSGPTTIRFEIRPVHSNDPDSRFDEWFTVTNGEKRGLVQALGNTPSQQLRIEGVESFVPGRLATTEIKVPAGLHRIELASQNHRFLFRVLQDRPEVRLPALPVVSPSTIAKAVTGDYGAMMVVEASADQVDNDCVRVLNYDCNARSYLIGKLADPHDCTSIEQAWKYLQARNINLAQSNELRLLPSEQPFEQTEQDELHQQAAKLAYDLSHRLHDHSCRLRTIGLLHDICQLDPSREDLRAYLNYAKSGTVWKGFDSFDARAGVRSFEVEHWTPETPEIRIRRSLAGLNQSNWVVAGTKEASLEVSDERPVRLRLKIRRPAVGFVPMAPTIALVEVGSESRRMGVDGGDAESIDFNLPAGDHRIRIAQENAMANHMLEVEAFEVLDDGSEVPFGSTTKEELSRTRTWMVALPEEPVKFSVKGPGLFRVDRRVDGRSEFEVLTVPESEDRTFTIYPKDGRSQEHIRIFQLTFTDRPSAIFSEKQKIPQQQIPVSEGVAQAAWLEPIIDLGTGLDDIEDLALLSPDSMPALIAEPDFQELGWQNLGTIASHFNYQQRRALDELPDTTSQPGRFTELGVTRYFHDPWANSDQRSQLFVRPRFDGGTSFGLNHQESYNLQPHECEPPEPAGGWGPIRAQWRSGLFAQDAGQPLFDGVSSFPWSAFVSGSVSRRQSVNENIHRTPRLQFFGKYLSEERNGFPSGELDQDVFTRYKADHRYGLRLSDQWVYQCCIDRRFWARPMLVTNADQLIPDNLGVHFGVDQLLGPLQLRLGYRVTGFFADNDRTNAAVQNLFDVDAMLETWHNRFWRSEARFSLRYDVASGESSFQFNLRNFFNQVRGYRDMRPDSVLFRSIREERSLRHLTVQPPDAYSP